MAETRRKDQEQDQRTQQLPSSNTNPKPASAILSLLPLVDKTNSDFNAGSKLRSRPVHRSQIPRQAWIFRNTALFEETDVIEEYLTGNYKAKELVTAGFLMLKQDITEKFSVNLGVRVEHTNIDYTGNIVEDDEVFKGQAQNKNDYTDVLPNINLKYRFSNYFVMKAAWTNSLARPKYFDLVPYFNVKPGDQEIAAGNPALEPVKSSNLDLMAEYYFKTVGIVSAGVFYKKLDGFYYTYIDDAFTNAKFDCSFPNRRQSYRSWRELAFHPTPQWRRRRCIRI